MLETLIFFDSDENFFLFNEFKEILIDLKTFLKIKFINEGYNINIYSLIKQTFERQNLLIQKQMYNFPYTPAIFIICIKQIVKKWIKNFNCFYRMNVKPQILYIAFHDMLLISENEEDQFTINHFDGNEACDKAVIIELVYNIILYAIFLLKKVMHLELELCNYLINLRNNFRIGLVANLTEAKINYLIIGRQLNDYDQSALGFFINTNYELYPYSYKNLNAFDNNKKIIQQYISLYSIWIFNILKENLISLGYFNNEFPFTETISNYFIMENLYDAIELKHKINLKEMKQVKEDLITISTNKIFLKNNLFVTKRNNKKLRTRKIKLIL